MGIDKGNQLKAGFNVLVNVNGFNDVIKAIF